MKTKQDLAQKNNIIRAAVMGANDGILSVSGIVIGVAGATTSSFAIFIAGFAGALAGTVSMAMGEYVSVHSENDAQKKAIIQQKSALQDRYQEEFNFVKERYMQQGISKELALTATTELMNQDPLGTTIKERYGFSQHHEISAVSAAVASMIAFPLGSLLPMLAITLLPEHIRIMATGIAVLIALGITGFMAARLSGADEQKATIRNIMAGVFTMIITYLIGSLIGA
ncbi:VIT1/CCC1 transporter family protein [Weissella sagaensis]|jgi:VIT1/CCC1 family predicted Fe2+/Mn2+ transporter|uniref:VIT family protein n=1 Tax=Weissella sagaensis TaxID=2559928 RepID=A0ABW1RS01_9LACO|nr:VIT family protein [Weissella sagaensis]KAA8432346.1 VIT family protein [Weissella paramesenteroides]MBU7568426.1 VIT family protein [Weissella hellenica]KAA8439387.1 VIT family protein [Weissella paramesenteroides]QDJ58569.1 VIT family protein [Weissella hellenica]QEA57510.1 VIT family protein [Weissella hellenica]